MKRINRMIGCFLAALLLFIGTAGFAAETWVCPQCHRINSGNFCTNDREPRPQVTAEPQWQCGTCGEMMPERFTRCGYCGTEKESVPSPTPVRIETPAPQWQCGTCGEMMPERFTRCGYCGTEKGIAPSPTPVRIETPTPEPQWQCGICGEMMPERYSRCGSCGAEKGSLPTPTPTASPVATQRPDKITWERDGTRHIEKYDADGNTVYSGYYGESGHVVYEIHYFERGIFQERIYRGFNSISGALESENETKLIYDERGRITDSYTFQTASSDSGSKELQSHTVYTRDEQGNILERVEYDRSESVTGNSVYSYNGEGQLVSIKEYSGGELTGESRFSYDAAGVRIEDVWLSYSNGNVNYESVDEMDSEGRIRNRITRSYDNGALYSTDEEHRDENGNAVRYDYSSKYGTTHGELEYTKGILKKLIKEGRNTNGILTSFEEWNYNEWGIPISKSLCYYRDDGVTLSSRSVAEYGNTGLIKRETTSYYAEDGISVWSESVKEYNSSGVPVSKKVRDYVHGENKLKSITEAVLSPVGDTTSERTMYYEDDGKTVYRTIEEKWDYSDSGNPIYCEETVLKADGRTIDMIEERWFDENVSWRRTFTKMTYYEDDGKTIRTIDEYTYDSNEKLSCWKETVYSNGKQDSIKVTNYDSNGNVIK